GPAYATTNPKPRLPESSRPRPAAPGKPGSSSRSRRELRRRSTAIFGGGGRPDQTEMILAVGRRRFNALRSTDGYHGTVSAHDQCDTGAGRKQYRDASDGPSN